MPILLPRDPSRKARLESARKSSEFLSAEMPKLQEKYAGSFVAVYDGKLVGTGASPPAAIESAVRAGADPEAILVAFVPKVGTSLFF